MRQAITIADHTIQPGEDRYIELPAPSLYTRVDFSIPLRVIHSTQPGPTLFIIATIHGDEINGIDIVRRLLRSPDLKDLEGTLIVLPVANPYGLFNRARELPDGRDLNRYFPGRAKGPLASRIAYLITEQIIKQCDVVVDLHTGGARRRNLPQLRVYIDQPGVRMLAEHFSAPVIIDAMTREGSLRETCRDLSIPAITYEAGEALRFNEFGIRVGLKGILNVMEYLNMIPHISKAPKIKNIKPMIAHSTLWVRAPNSGILNKAKQFGSYVAKGEILATVTDPFGNDEKKVTSPVDGLVIGINNLPLINAGDALFHIGAFEYPEELAKQVDELYSFID